MNFIDQVIGFINPQAGLQRARSRAALEAVRKYDAATKGRRGSGWTATGTSANSETALSLSTLRDRARELVRNNPYAKNAVDVITTNTIGTGIIPRPRMNGSSSQTLVENWNKWASTKRCDFEGQHTFYGIQALAMRTIAESGEVLIRKRMVNDKEMPLRLQVLEPDFLDSAKNFDKIKDGGYIVQGVEFDSNGKRVAYHLFDRHPGEGSGSLSSKRVDASDILHIYSVDRPGQVRGVPFGASAMLRLRDFDDYEDAQLMRQKIAACFAVFVQDASADAIGGTSSAKSDLPERVEPGIIEQLPAGKTVTFASPPQAEGYDIYTRKVLQAIAVGYGVTYEALTSDLSNVNFSSGRMGWLEFARRIIHWQNNIIIPRLCDEVWTWFMAASKMATGKGESVIVDWTPPRREMIDPVKETNAIILAIRAGLISWQEAVREQGYDPDTLLAHIAEDNKKFDEKKVILDSDARVGKAVPQQTENKDGKNSDTKDKNAS